MDGDLDKSLRDLAEVRRRVRGPVDAVAVVREGRDELEHRGLQVSPDAIVQGMRGLIVDARIAYPEVLHVEIKDTDGKLWRLATQDAEWSPADPGELVGRSVEDAVIDGDTRPIGS